MRVVVVEDDAGMRNAIDELLRVAGFEVTTFASGEELLRAVPEAACLVIDLQLPGVSGFELYERVRRVGEPPVVFITAHDTPIARSRAERLGAAAYLNKPFGGRELVEVVRRALAGRSPES
jgi:DNA-binding response OmpR family regulator